MNNNIELLLKNNFDYFLKLVKLGIISKDVACDTVIEEENLYHIINFASAINYNLEALEDAIIKTRDSSAIYWFAQEVKGANILKLQDAIIELGEPYYICSFAMHFNKEANIQKLEDALIAHSHYGYEQGLESIYQFALNVVGANIFRLQDTMIEKSDKLSYLYLFARDIKGADILKLEDAIISELKYSSDYRSIYQFALLPGANVSKLEDAVIKKGEIDYIYEFAREVPNADVLKLEDAIIEIGRQRRNLHTIYHFALDIQGADISKLEDYVIENDRMNGDYINYFMHNVKGANVKKLQKALQRLKQLDELNNINSKFKDNPLLLKLLTLLANEEDAKILESQATYAELFQDDKGVTRKLEKNSN